MAGCESYGAGCHRAVGRAHSDNDRGIYGRRRATAGAAEAESQRDQTAVYCGSPQRYILFLLA